MDVLEPNTYMTAVMPPYAGQSISEIIYALVDQIEELTVKVTELDIQRLTAENRGIRGTMTISVRRQDAA